MKPRPTKFDVRENTGSSRQHAPRLAVRSFPAQSARSSPASREDVPLLSALSPQESSTRSPNNAAYTAATGGDEGHGKHLLTVHEVADLLQVPVSWVYGRTRKRSLERLPGYRLGKYWRFRQDEVLAWVGSQTARLACCLTLAVHSGRHRKRQTSQPLEREEKDGSLPVPRWLSVYSRQEAEDVGRTLERRRDPS